MSALDKASDFMTANGRLLDRRRFDFLFGDGEPEAVVAALAAYANPDGGFGWGLHSDLRSAGSEPVAALEALEILEEIGPAASGLTVALCDWLDDVSLPDGGLPFALAGAGGAGSAPMWAAGDPARPSLLITSAVCGTAHRIAQQDPAVAGHPWLARATDGCRRAIAALEPPVFAIELRFVLQLLDALQDTSQDAGRELGRLAGALPASGEMAVVGGAEGEALRPLDFSPTPGRPLRELLGETVIAADLDRLVSEQADDGGWDVDWQVYSPAAVLEWRGSATVRALKILRENGRLDGALTTATVA